MEGGEELFLCHSVPEPLRPVPLFWLADGSCHGAAWRMECHADAFPGNTHTFTHTFTMLSGNFASFFCQNGHSPDRLRANRQAGNQLRHLRAPWGPSLSLAARRNCWLRCKTPIRFLKKKVPIIDQLKDYYWVMRGMIPVRSEPARINRDKADASCEHCCFIGQPHVAQPLRLYWQGTMTIQRVAAYYDIYFY